MSHRARKRYGEDLNILVGRRGKLKRPYAVCLQPFVIQENTENAETGKRSEFKKEEG